MHRICRRFMRVINLPIIRHIIKVRHYLVIILNKVNRNQKITIPYYPLKFHINMAKRSTPIDNCHGSHRNWIYKFFLCDSYYPLILSILQMQHFRYNSAKNLNHHLYIGTSYVDRLSAIEKEYPRSRKLSKKIANFLLLCVY